MENFICAISICLLIVILSGVFIFKMSTKFNEKNITNMSFAIIILYGCLIINSVTSCNGGPDYVGEFEMCGFPGVVAFYLKSDGTCNNGKGSQNGGIYGNWEKTSNGIVISGMGSEWDGNYILDGNTDGVALKKGNIRYCNDSYR